MVAESTVSPDAATHRGIQRAPYPFAAIVGCGAAKRALLLLAVEPGLRGALIGSTGGSDDSLLARAFGALLPAPALDSISSVDPLGAVGPDTGVVDLPLNITEDRLLGELDLERTIQTGKREISTGLLARANGRVLFANDINLLDAGVAARVAQTIDSRCVRVEREGIGAVQEADFRFVGIFNTSEGDPNSLLRDRIGLIVDSSDASSPAEKAVAIERAFRFDRDPVGFAEEFEVENSRLKHEVETARARLSRVRISKTLVRQISQIGLRLGVEGNRADVFALKAARAGAALAGRYSVTKDDLVSAIQLVLVPRATRCQAPTEKTKEHTERQEDKRERGSTDVAQSDLDAVSGAIEDMMIEAIDTPVPSALFATSENAHKQSREGKRFKATASARGRYVRSVTSKGRSAKIAIDATLRACAPYQRLRRVRSAPTAKSSVEADCLNKLAADVQMPRVRIEPDDLRFKEFKHRAGTLFIFVVDASGSMALNRMAHAKGAINRLLQQAYLHRDKVALIRFRGTTADVLLAPTRSVELARRLVDAMPAGGGTPVAAGVMKAIELARFSRLRGTTESMLVLFTDGRANVGFRDVGAGTHTAITIDEELSHLGTLVKSENMQAVVVDTKSKFVSNGEGEALARTLRARYLYLPRADSAAVCDAISAIAIRPSQH